MPVTVAEDSVRARHSVAVSGVPGARPIVFAHGFGCSQEMWRFVAPHFETDHQVVLFDHVGAGSSDLTAYDRRKYDSLHGYADDVLEILAALDLEDAVFVGHSVSAMIGVLAASREPSRFGALVLVGPSPRYVNDDGYAGGFGQEDIDALLDTLDANYLGWSSTMAPLIIGNPQRPELGAEMVASFCRTDPAIAQHFARVTFLSDNRRDLRDVSVPTLVVQCRDDLIAPQSVGEYVHREIRGSRFTVLDATGHCPNLSAPDELVQAIRSFLA
ncbi:alpha/beta fold hydrolase [Naasia sp. SYSU D00948]|uniref:alpha/beta fold hydrolase n=1 Tax=Naasia sp. SYSU D00948 TaxID=2817379 RepID=UPI001B3142FE|nr:alpha/beta hydrolase [Naasia sp. SYSU D00948]